MLPLGMRQDVTMILAGMVLCGHQEARAGHWEGDLIIGLGTSAIGTLVERQTRFTILLHLPRMAEHGVARGKNGPALAGHGAEAVRKAITGAMLPLPQELRKSLTSDQGPEMAQHPQLKDETGMRIYFCEPRSPWQRGPMKTRMDQ
jgi:IS30 family transposase